MGNSLGFWIHLVPGAPTWPPMRHLCDRIKSWLNICNINKEFDLQRFHRHGNVSKAVCFSAHEKVLMVQPSSGRRGRKWSMGFERNKLSYQQAPTIIMLSRRWRKRPNFHSISYMKQNDFHRTKVNQGPYIVSRTEGRLAKKKKRRQETAIRRKKKGEACASARLIHTLTYSKTHARTRAHATNVQRKSKRLLDRWHLNISAVAGTFNASTTLLT